MTALTIATLKEICNKVPDDYEVRFIADDGSIIYIKDKIEIDITNSLLILKD
jgi:hypothetical protein